MDADLLKKLKIQSGQRILLLNAPHGFQNRIQPLPEDTILDLKSEGAKMYDLVHLFVHSVAELQDLGPAAAQAVKNNAYFWISYPKKSSKMNTDLNRDAGWTVISEAGYEGIAMISIDETWSAMRFREVDLVKSSGSRRERLANRNTAPSAAAKDRILEMPDDLQKALNQNAEAKQFFEGLSYSHRKEYVRWITDAKREETRIGRVEKTIEKLKDSIKSPFLKI